MTRLVISVARLLDRPATPCEAKLIRCTPDYPFYSSLLGVMRLRRLRAALHRRKARQCDSQCIHITLVYEESDRVFFPGDNQIRFMGRGGPRLIELANRVEYRQHGVLVRVVKDRGAPLETERMAS